MKSRIREVVIFLVFVISVNLAAVPETINFQGALKDANGVPVNDTQIVIFRIYDSVENGTLIWSEQHNSVVISDGIFSQELGNYTVFPVGLFDNPELYITFFFGGSEMTPRQKLLAVPYALQAENSNHIEDVALSGLVQQDMGGNVAITGTMTADSLIGDGSGITGLSDIYDDVYVNQTEPDTISVSSSAAALTLDNPGGDGIEVSNVGDFGLLIDYAHTGGVHVSSTSGVGIGVSSASLDGVYVHNAGNPSTQYQSNADNGFEVAGAEGNGLYVGKADENGVNIHTVGNDGFFVNSTGGDGFNVYSVGNPSIASTNSNKNGFEVGGAEGYGLWVGRADLNGIRIDSAGDDGVYVYNAGTPTTQNTSTAKNGFEVAGAEGSGLYVGRADEIGVLINQAVYDGVYVGYAGGDGIGINITSGSGFSVTTAGTPSTSTSITTNNGFEVAGAEGFGLYVGRADSDGVYVDSAGDDGVYVMSANDDGVFVNTAGDTGVLVYNAGGNGVYANTTQASHEWGITTPDKINADSGYSGMRTTGYGRNNGTKVLEPGDLVCISGGYEENVLGRDGIPVVIIEKAKSSNSDAIFGIVEYKVYIREELEEFEDGKTEIQKSFRYAEGSISNGDYLSVIVFGPADVKIDSKEDIRSGQMLASGDGIARKVETREIDGMLIAENVGVLGKALENSNGRDKIKVFVNCR